MFDDYQVRLKVIICAFLIYAVIVLPLTMGFVLKRKKKLFGEGKFFQVGLWDSYSVAFGALCGGFIVWPNVPWVVGYAAVLTLIFASFMRWRYKTGRSKPW